MKRGLSPIKYKDTRTYDFHRTFGTITQMPTEFNFDQTNSFPNQNGDGFPQACTAYTTVGMASNSDKTLYDDQPYTYEKTKQMMGVSGDVPCDQMTALKSATVYGVKKKSEPDQDALTHRQSPYFIVRKLNGSYFEGLISAMQLKKGTLSIGTYWPMEFEYPNPDGTIKDFTVPSDWNEGHNWEACGVKIINNVPYIICKSWQGPNFGDRGYIYFSEKQINTLLGMNGAGAFGQKHAEPGDIKAVKFEIISYLITLCYRLMNLLK